jgi:hypothetical protein
MQKKDCDCGDNTQRDKDEERDPHANRNAVGKRDALLGLLASTGQRVARYSATRPKFTTNKAPGVQVRSEKEVRAFMAQRFVSWISNH